MLTDLPVGTITFLFTDIEGSTRLWEQRPEAMRDVLARHDALIRSAIESNRGHVFKTMGDQFCAAFATASDAITAALWAQRALGAAAWDEVGTLRVRIALHTGLAEQRGGDYFGRPLNRVARLLAAAHGGQVLLSQVTGDLASGSLPLEASLKDLGAHRLKDLQEPERIFQLTHPDLLLDFPPLRSLEAFAHNLPRQLTSFIGREEAMAEVRRLLVTTALVTLTGMGGCGKTRLALQVAADLVEEYPDGVWLVELASLAEPSLVPQAVASVLGVQEKPGQSLLDTLSDHLRVRSLLLLLDNCEHLVEACARLAEALLRSCPHLRILATSRETLGIAGETPWPVPSLSLPEPQRLFAGAEDLPSAVMQYEAARLFADRAQTLLPAFSVTSENGPSVARICSRLDGIPLAIELAAARVKVLSVEQIDQRLDDRFRLLTGGSRTALPRHQTLRAAIDWSHNLLSEAERSLMRRVSVFAGGWTLEAAEAVCTGEGIEAWEILDLLAQLVEKSLVVVVERGGEARYRLLETLRAYGRDRLREAGEEALLSRRHRDYFLELARQVQPELYGPDQAAWFDRLDTEHDNLRTALDWSRSAAMAPEAGADAEAGLRLASALGRFWWVRAYWTEGRRQLADVLSLPAAQEPTAARAKALASAGILAIQQDEHPIACTLHDESLAIRRALGDPREIAMSLIYMANGANSRGDCAAARAFAEESLSLWRELGDRWGIAMALCNLGVSDAYRGEYAAARPPLDESLALVRELGDRRSIANNLVLLGLVERCQGDHATARGIL